MSQGHLRPCNRNQAPLTISCRVAQEANRNRKPWEVLNGVGVDEVGGTFPFFCLFFVSLCFFLFLSFFFLRFSSLFCYSPRGKGGNDCNLLQRWGISLRPSAPTPLKTCRKPEPSEPFLREPKEEPVLVAFQTQTQNSRVLATQFPKSQPCPRW